MLLAHTGDDAGGQRVEQPPAKRSSRRMRPGAPPLRRPEAIQARQAGSRDLVLVPRQGVGFNSGRPRAVPRQDEGMRLKAGARPMRLPLCSLLFQQSMASREPPLVALSLCMAPQLPHADAAHFVAPTLVLYMCCASICLPEARRELQWLVVDVRGVVAGQLLPQRGIGRQ